MCENAAAGTSNRRGRHKTRFNYRHGAVTKGHLVATPTVYPPGCVVGAQFNILKNPG